MLRHLMLAALAIVLLARPTAATAAVYDDATGQFRMWVPDDQPVVYGFYISYNSSGDDNRTLAERASWQGYAQTFGFGIIGTNILDTGDPGALLTAMAAFAQQSGHPEVEHAPVIVEGVSLGGYLAMEFGAAYPERTIAILSGASRQLVNVEGNSAFNKVPSLFHLGETDGDAAKRKADLLDIRAGGAQLGFWIQWGFDHGRWHGNKVGWSFLQDCVRLRYPTGQDPRTGPVQLIDIPDDYGWLADPETWDSGFAKIYAWADYPGDRSRAFWLPTKDFAYIYRAHATHEAALSFVLPNSTVDWHNAAPGAEVPLEVSPGALTGVTSIELFDGATSVASWNAGPFTGSFTLPTDARGVHGLTAVATVQGGDRRTGLIVPVIVANQGLPGGGGLDDPNRPDAGPTPGSDAGPGGGADTDAGGCGCGTAPDHGWASLLLILLGAAIATRRR